VESANVVGYTSASCDAAKWYLIGVQFQDITTQAFDLQDFVEIKENVAGTDDADSPNLKLWNGNGYTDYYYIQEDLDGNQNCWADDSAMFIADGVTVSTGTGAFFKSPASACTITVAGQVAAASSMNVPLVSGKFNLIANPYPVALDLNGTQVAWVDALLAGTDDSNSPNIKVWKGNGYTDYFFIEEDLDGNQNCWADDSAMFIAENAIVNPFSGFWLKYSNNDQNVNLTFSK